MNDEETFFTFPCEYPIKVIGYTADDFEILVLSIVKAHVKELTEHCFSSRLSKDGKYTSITITFTAESKAQLDALYRDLTRHEQVLTVL